MPTLSERMMNDKYRLTHGNSYKEGFAAWKMIIARCRNPNNVNYKRYGARGIQICERWLNFENFINDMGHKPTPQHSIERINNDGNYEPSNCRWATRSEQAKNRRNNFIVTFNNKKMTLKEACDLNGLSYKTIHARVRTYGWDITKALNTPIKGK